jgi:hypothetical protein
MLGSPGKVKPQAVPVQGTQTGLLRMSESEKVRARQAGRDISRALSEGDVKTVGKLAAKVVGNYIWSRLTPKEKLTYARCAAAAKAVEHHLEGYYRSGQQTALAVARERGYSPEHVEAVGKVLAVADAAARWTANVPIAHSLIESLTPVGGPLAFAAAKGAFYFPVASLGFVGFEMGREALSGRNPFEMIRRARERVRSQGTHHKGLTSKTDFADLLFRGLAAAEDREEFLALAFAAVDEAGGDLSKAAVLLRGAQ